MNPIPEEPKTTPAQGASPFNPATFVPEGSSPEADKAALEAIGVLEAEESTSRALEQPQSPVPEAPVVPIIVPPAPVAPVVPIQPPVAPSVPPSPVSPPVPSGPVIQEEQLASSDTPFKAFPSNHERAAGPFGTMSSSDAPVQTNANPFAGKKMPTKKLVIILIAAIVLIGGVVAGYFIMQSMQEPPAVTPQTTTGDQPGGTVETPTDTEASVNASATVIETDVDSPSDTIYDDSVLSDTTLYEN